MEERKDFSRGIKILEQARSEGSKEAKAYTIDKKSMENDNKWPDIDIEYMKGYIKSRINKQGYHHHHKWTDNELIIQRFVDKCLSIANKKYRFNEDAYNDALEFLGIKTKGKRDEFDIINDFLYEQRYFILFIIGLVVHSKYDRAKKGLKDHAKSYYPAKYMSNKAEKNHF